MAERSKQVAAVAKRRPPNAGKGRPRGSKNKTTALLKDAILLAAEEAGSDGSGSGGMVGYLTKQAVANPGPFMALLGKVLPVQLASDPDEPLQHKVTVRIVGER